MRVGDCKHSSGAPHADGVLHIVSQIFSDSSIRCKVPGATCAHISAVLLAILRYHPWLYFMMVWVMILPVDIFSAMMKHKLPHSTILLCFFYYLATGLIREDLAARVIMSVHLQCT